MIDTSPSDRFVDKVYHVLSDRRRRLLLDRLTDDTKETVESLADWVAERDRTGTDRERVAVDIYHVHLPLMRDAGFVEDDPAETHVRLTRDGQRAVDVHRTTVAHLTECGSD